ncbi:MAG TPA: hypothetical protein IAC17_01980 [Candidatus Faecousia faecipullorum]|nr:hypothetical protein [Candidatus Faecousia faecipullorum]
MKTMKRLIALLMVVMTMTALLALPASAAESDNEVALRYPVLRCDCGGTMRVIYHHNATYEDMREYDLYECDTCHATLIHVTGVG